MFIITITDGTPEQIATMLEGIAQQGFRAGAISDSDESQFGSAPVWANDGQHIGYITAIVEVTP